MMKCTVVSYIMYKTLVKFFLMCCLLLVFTGNWKYYSHTLFLFFPSKIMRRIVYVVYCYILSLRLIMLCVVICGVDCFKFVSQFSVLHCALSIRVHLLIVASSHHNNFTIPHHGFDEGWGAKTTVDGDGWSAEGPMKAGLLLLPFPKAANMNLSCLAALMLQRWYRLWHQNQPFALLLRLQSSWMGRRCRQQREAWRETRRR